MAYADYEYYTNTFYGTTIPGISFDQYAAQASDYIDRMTMNRAASYTGGDEVKKACCACAEQMFMLGSTRAALVRSGGSVASETVGKHSVSYRSPSETIALLEKQMRDVVTGYLLHTGLLYRGINNVHAAYNYVDIG